MRKASGMKLYAYLLAASLLGCSQTPNVSGSQTPAATASPSATPGQERSGRRERFRKMMTEMDTDHDGKLSDAEREVGFDKLVKESDRFRERVDKNGDGKISADERKAGLATFMKRRGRRSHGEGSSSPAPSESETPE